MSLPGVGTDVTPHVTPTITVGGTAIPDDMVQNLVQTVVDTHLHLPDMFEITLLDGDQSAIGLFTIGAHVEIFGGAPGDSSANSLIKGEVTALEGDFRSPVIHTIVRGYEKAHRMQRVSHTRAFVNMKDSDIASQIAGAYNYDGSDISDSKVTHDHVAQIDQTDWDFLKYRAAELGFEVGVAGGKFFFRKASGSPDDDAGGMMGALAGAVSSLTGGAPPTLTLGDDLLYFRPRVTAGDLTSDVEVRVWDPISADVISGSTSVQTGTATLSNAPAPSDMAGMFKEDSPLSFLALPSIKIPGLKLPSLGSAPSTTARVVCDRPVEIDSAANAATGSAAKGLAEHVGSTFAEAEGSTYGNPKIQAGQPVQVAGVPDEFAGRWVVSNAHHTFIPSEGGYRTDFVVSGRHDRSMLGLASLGRTNGARPVINGFVCGIVTNNNDPKKIGRVKVAFPVFSNAFESDWARVVQVGLGADWGLLFTPEVHDEVLVGFEFGDVRRPYVLGGLINGNTTNDIMSSAIKSTGMSAKVVQRGLITPTGNRIIFDDDEMVHGQPMPPPSKSAVTISDKDGKLAITLDKTSGSIEISAGPIPPAVTTSTITIKQQGPGGSVSIQADGNITVAAGTAGQLSLQAGMGVTIDGGLGGITLKGTQASPIKLGG